MTRAELAADLAAEYGTTPEAAAVKLRGAVAPFHDPYGGCETSCTHDLAHGALVPELREGDGPYPDELPLLGAGWLAARIAAAASLQSGRIQT